MTNDERHGLALPPMRESRAREILDRTRADDGTPAVLARRAAKLAAPLILIAPTPADRRRLARAVHAVGERPGPLVIGDDASGDAPPSWTLLLDLALASAGSHVGALVECLVDDGEPWLLIGARTLAEVPTAIRSLAATVALERPALDDASLLSVARDTLRTLGAQVGEDPDLAPDASAWLRSRPEIRDLDTLTSLLRRALAAATPGESIGVRHLASPERVSSPGEVSPASEPVVLAPTAARLEYVLAELAHELRNPLVTLKTVADHLDDLAADEELRTRFTGLARDAVTRMDDLLENLVSYGRLATPSPRSVVLSEVLDEAVRDAEPALAGRRLRVRALAGTASCLSDPVHLGFALKNLLVGIAQTAAPDGEVVVDASMNGVVRVRFAADADAATLQTLLAASEGRGLYDPTYQPLPFSLARAVLETVGGSVDVGPAGDGGTVLDVHLPVTDGPA